MSIVAPFAKQAVKGALQPIAFAGLTATGKTTHARLLASELGIPLIEATPILLRILNLETRDAQRAWFEQLAKSESLRVDDSADDELEETLLQLAYTEVPAVYDTWALPWLYQGPMVRIWLGSTPETRAWKAFVSQGPQPALPITDCAYLVGQKDEGTRQRFMRRHGFDLYESRGVFDAILDNSGHIEEPKIQASARGIASFAPYISAAIDWLVARDPRTLDNLAISNPDEFQQTVRCMRAYGSPTRMATNA